jgi:hypothetical protein
MAVLACYGRPPLSRVGVSEEYIEPSISSNTFLVRSLSAADAAHCRTRSLSARSAHPRLSRAASPALLARTNVGMAVERYVRLGSGAIPLDEHSRT